MLIKHLVWTVLMASSVTPLKEFSLWHSEEGFSGTIKLYVALGR